MAEDVGGIERNPAHEVPYLKGKPAVSIVGPSRRSRNSRRGTIGPERALCVTGSFSFQDMELAGQLGVDDYK